MRAVGWDEPASIALLALFGLSGVLFLVFTGLAVLVARRRSRRRRLKALVVAVAGGVCGTLWVLFIATILAAARPGALTGLPLLAVGVIVALSAAVLLSGPGRSREVAGRSLMTTGFNSLALPIAALISFLVGGAQLPAGSAGAELSAVILGVRLAGNVATVGLSVGGLLAGVFLVFLGIDCGDRCGSDGAGGPMQPQPRSFKARSCPSGVTCEAAAPPFARLCPYTGARKWLVSSGTCKQPEGRTALARLGQMRPSGFLKFPSRACA